MGTIEYQILSEAAKWILIAIASLMLSSVRKILKRMKLLEYKLQATDHALERSFKNGYAEYRDAKLIELFEADRFVNKK
jgi:hypothetical protein